MRAVRFSFACLCVMSVWLAPHQLDANELPADRDRVQRVVDDFRTRLGITQDVRVSIVASNSLMVSVQRQVDPDSGFVLAFEGAFLNELSEEELRAVVAHELGHVWIFTHHPYLQTEQLANGIAMRLVTRESLEPVYDRVWKRVGAVGDIGRYLGEKPSPAAETPPASVSAGFTPTATGSPSTPSATPAAAVSPDAAGRRSDH
jgi:Peptidase family M48